MTRTHHAFSLFIASFTVLSAALAFAQAPVPLINLPLVPDATAPGGASFTLTVNGTGYVSGSVVNWNGNARPTTFINSSQLTAAIQAVDIITASTAWVTVVNPAPGGASTVAFFSITPNTGNFVAFDLASSPDAGFCPASIARADFNGDGNLDLAIADYCGSTVSILLGDGTGNFILASSPPTGRGPQSLAVGDFNGDGKLDVATANYLDDTFSILLGDGAGNFVLASSPPTGGSLPFSVAAGDFNGDGKLDLAVANLSNQVSILLGDGTGNFTLASLATGVNGPQSIAVGDFSADGNLDLAVVNYVGSVSILLGDGMGNFTLGSSPPTGSAPVSVVAGDFNQDGTLDLAVANSNYPGSSVSILLGDGTGNFTLASSPPTGTNPFSVAEGDFNADGKLDLAAGCGDGTVSILLGDGTGNFTLASSPAPGGYEPSVAVGDFNADGKLDLAVADYVNNDVAILLNNTSVCTTPPVITLSATPTSLWPANGRMVPVTVFGTITDNDCTVTTRDYAVTDEYGIVQPSGSVTLGPGGAYSFSVLLQASRRGNDLDGRDYAITVSASNNAGLTASKTTMVTVPHDRRH